MKLRNDLIKSDRLIGLSNTEINFILYLARRQDDNGNVFGVYYQDVMNELDICKQSYYNLLNSMENKKIISIIHKGEHGDYIIQLLNNSFVKASYKKGTKDAYVSMNRFIFRKKIFKRLKANEKIMLLRFMCLTYANKGKYKRKASELYDYYIRLFNVSKRTIRGYLHTLKKYFKINLEKECYIIKFIPEYFKQNRNMKEDKRFYYAMGLCRQSGAKNIKKEVIQDIAGIIKYHTPKAIEYGFNILNLIQQCIEKSLDEQVDNIIHPKRVTQLLMQIF